MSKETVFFGAGGVFFVAGDSEGGVLSTGSFPTTRIVGVVFTTGLAA